MKRKALVICVVGVAVCWALLFGPGVVAPAFSAAAGAENGEPDNAKSFFEDLDLPGLFLGQGHWWYWLILAGAVFLGWAAGRITTMVLGRIAARLQARDQLIRHHVVKDLIGPAKLALLALGLAVGLAGLAMSEPLAQFRTSMLLLLYSIAVFWYAYNLVSVVEVALRRLTAKTASTLDDQLVPMIRKALRIVLVVLAAVFVIDSVLQRDIFAVVAAIGVLGLPLGFAAQDTLKNLFGSIIILFNRPFQVGDRVVYADYDGVIEEIGFQSIRIRTLDGHVVTIPNSKIASDPVKNIAKRPFIKRVMNVTITYDTPRAKIEQAVDILRGILEEDELRQPIHATINGDEYPPRVYFNDYTADSLNILMIYWFAPPAYWDFLEHGQKLNLRIFEEFEKAGIEFAFPTQTLYLAGDPKRELALKMLGGNL